MRRTDVNVATYMSLMIPGSAGNNNIKHVSMVTFVNRGGALILAPKYEDFEANPAIFNFGVTSADFVVPVCHEGMNRSQVSTSSKINHANESVYLFV